MLTDRDAVRRDLQDGVVIIVRRDGVARLPAGQGVAAGLQSLVSITMRSEAMAMGYLRGRFEQVDGRCATVLASPPHGAARG